jgi:hypothetical protein
MPIAHPLSKKPWLYKVDKTSLRVRPNLALQEKHTACGRLGNIQAPRKSGWLATPKEKKDED